MRWESTSPKMHLTVVEYPVIVGGNKSKIELAPRSSLFNDTVFNATEVALNTMTGPTTMGGLCKAFSDTYNSESNLTFVASYGYELLTTGATSHRYAVLDTSSRLPTRTARSPSQTLRTTSSAQSET